MVTHRIVSVEAEGIRAPRATPVATPTRGSLRPDAPTMSRVEFAVPWIGWAYLCSSTRRAGC